MTEEKPTTAMVRIHKESLPKSWWEGFEPEVMEDEIDLCKAIRDFKNRFPYWWYTIGECGLSCDASCAPRVESEYSSFDAREADYRFNAGFHSDIPKPSTPGKALRRVMEDAQAAIDAYNAREGENG